MDAVTLMICGGCAIGVALLIGVVNMLRFINPSNSVSEDTIKSIFVVHIIAAVTSAFGVLSLLGGILWYVLPKL